MVNSAIAIEALWNTPIMMWTIRIDRSNLKDLNSFPKVYNEFKRAAFIKWMKQNDLFISHVDAGREYSPVFYVVPMSEACIQKVKDSLAKLKPDELDVMTHKTRKAIRVWWD